jgi:hypothetical protein
MRMLAERKQGGWACCCADMANGCDMASDRMRHGEQ